MTSYLYYPGSADSLERIIPLICPVRVNQQSFTSKLLLLNSHIKSLSAVCTTRTAILVPGRNAALLSYASLLTCSPQQHSILSSMASGLGGDVLSGLAEFMSANKLFSLSNHLTVYRGKGLAQGVGLTNNFLQALDQYDRSLTQYNGLITQGTTGQMITAAGKRLAGSIEKTNALANLKCQLSFKRYNNLARQSRSENLNNNLMIPVPDHRQLQNLVSFAKSTQVLSNGVICLTNCKSDVDLSDGFSELFDDIEKELLGSTSLPSDGLGAHILLTITSSGVVICINTPGHYALKMRRLQKQFL